MKTVFAYPGLNDPYDHGVVDGVARPGPILACLRGQSAARFVLVHAISEAGAAEATRSALAREFPGLEIEYCGIPVMEDSAFAELVPALEVALENRTGRENEEAWVLTSAGPSRVQAAWLAVAASGRFAAKFVECRTRGIAEIPLAFNHGSYCRTVPDPPSTADRVEDAFPDFDALRGPGPAHTVAEPDELFLDDALRDTGCLGEHPRFRRALRTAQNLAQHTAPILIEGETGTGKDVIARLIHRLSGRRRAPLVAVNCAALPETLVESILFGHKRGAFTGAVSGQRGKFELADGGTLFLDEIGELSSTVQAKLLRGIEDGVVDPLGASVPIRVDVRVISATNRDLRHEVAGGGFREDLYYRLRVGEIRLPPLRERREDIALLAMHFLDKVNVSLRTPKRFAPEALAYLQRQPWPGNIRELRNTLERAAMLVPHDILRPDDFQTENDLAIRYEQAEADLPILHEGFSMEGYLGDIRHRLMKKALDQANHNQSEAARLLGVTPQAVHKYLKQERSK